MNITPNGQYAQAIEMQQQLVAEKAQELREEQEKLNQFVLAQEICLKADAAQQKIEEGQRELEEAIASMPPEVAAFWRGVPDEPTHKPTEPPVPEPTAQTIVPPVVDVNVPPADDTPPVTDVPPTDDAPPATDEEVIRAFDAILNRKSLLRINVPILQEAAFLAGVSPEGKKKDIADRIRNVPDIASMVGVDIREKGSKFKQGDRIQDPWGNLGTVEKTEKKPEAGGYGSDSITSETGSISSDVPNTASSPGIPDAAAALPKDTEPEMTEKLHDSTSLLQAVG